MLFRSSNESGYLIYCPCFLVDRVVDVFVFDRSTEAQMPQSWFVRSTPLERSEFKPRGPFLDSPGKFSGP